MIFCHARFFFSLHFTRSSWFSSLFDSQSWISWEAHRQTGKGGFLFLGSKEMFASAELHSLLHSNKKIERGKSAPNRNCSYIVLHFQQYKYNYWISRIMPYFLFLFWSKGSHSGQFDNWWISWTIYVPNIFYCKVWFLDNALFLEQSVFAIALLSIYFPGETGNRSSQGFPAKKIFI